MQSLAQDGPPHHVRVQCLHLPPIVCLQLVQCGRSGRVDLALQVSPEAEVTRVQIRVPSRPVQAPDGLPAQDPVLELIAQVPHVGVGDMTRSPVLLPPEIVKVAAVPLTELGQHSVLKKPMVSWPRHALVAENSQAGAGQPASARGGGWACRDDT